MSFFKLANVQSKIAPIKQFITPTKTFIIAVCLLCLASILEFIGLASVVTIANAIFKKSNSHFIQAELPLFGVISISIIYFSALVIASISIRAILVATAYNLIGMAQIKIQHSLTEKLVRSWLSASWSHLKSKDQNEIFDHIYRVTNEFKIIGYFLPHFLTGLLLGSIFLITIGWISFPTLLLSTIIIVPFRFIIQGISNYSKQLWEKSTEDQVNKTKIIQEALLNTKEVKGRNQENNTLLNLNNCLSTLYKKEEGILKATSFQQQIPDVLVVFGVIAIISLTYQLNLSSGDSFILSLMLLYRALHYITQASRSWFEIDTRLTLVSDLNNIITDLTSAKEFTAEDQVRLLPFTSSIELKDISFSYPKSNFKILNRVNLKILPNESILIQGPSGAGKTTLIDLISGLILPDIGAIEIDGTKLSSNNLKSWRDQISYITQEPLIFKASIKEYLTDGLSIKPYMKLEEALRLVELPEDVIKVQNNYEHTRDTTQLSVGQKQRLAIARALLEKKSLIIMDEPTSGLDSDTELIVMRRIIARCTNYCTFLAISHSKNIETLFDKVYYLEDGVFKIKC